MGKSIHPKTGYTFSYNGTYWDDTWKDQHFSSVIPTLETMQEKKGFEVFFFDYNKHSNG